MSLSPRARVLLLAAAILLALGALIWYLSGKSRTTPVTPIAPPVSSELPPSTKDAGSGATASAPATPTTGSASTPNVSPSATNAPSPVSANAQTTNPAGEQLLIPVAGIKPEQLQDTYTQSRSEGRTHNSIDIIAPRGTPVIATADGKIIKLFQSARGGITVYQLGADDRTVYYYAHLERYADGLAEDRFARRGETIGYVGDTGNAGTGNCHLHFSIWRITDPKHYWDGENINPYPLLVK